MSAAEEMNPSPRQQARTAGAKRPRRSPGLAKQIFADVKDDIKTAKKIRLHWRGVVTVMVGTLLICLLLDHFEIFNLARPAMTCIVALGFIIAIKRNLKGFIWFWVTMAVLAVLHAILVSFVSWTTGWVPAVTLAGIATVDLYLMLTIVDAVGRIVEQSAVPGRSGKEDSPGPGGPPHIA